MDRTYRNDVRGGSSNLVHRGMEGEDWSGCLMKFEDGTTAVLEANYVTVGGMEDVIDIYGTEGACISTLHSHPR